MNLVLPVVFLLLFAQPVFAKELYICAPKANTGLISRVVLADSGGGDYLLTFFKKDSQGNEEGQSGPARYYDDITYLGYYAETLNATLEFDAPADLERARFQLGEILINVSCK